MTPFAPLIAPLVETVGKLADDLFTSDEERMRAQLESDKIGLEAARIDADLIKGQQEINKVEAQHASVFVAGWRPAIGWVGVSALAYQFLCYPLLTWAWVYMQAMRWIPDSVKPPPMLDVEALIVLLTGILGIAGARTFEKVKGVAK
jgi:Holin of 3TMs, for gene-transfer release